MKLSANDCTMTRRQMGLALLSGATLAVAPALHAGPTPRPARPLQFQALGGQMVSLEKLRGKAVLVMFFSTDCPHCQQAATRMGPVYEELRKKSCEFLGLAMNPGRSRTWAAS